jgi:hypothetical protein
MYFDWLTLVEKSAEMIVQVVPGIPPALKPIIVEAIQIAERSQLSGPEKKALAMNAIGGHVDEPAIQSIEVSLLSEVVDEIVAHTNAGVWEPVENAPVVPVPDVPDTK